MKQWSTKFKQCVRCGTTKTFHKAKGLCNTCYVYLQSTDKDKRREFTCVGCEKVFMSKGYVNPKHSLRYCSPKCDRENARPTSKFKTKGQLEEAIIDLIKKEDRYLPRLAIRKGLKINPDKLFNKFNISLLGLHKKAGVRIPKRKKEALVYYILHDFYPDIIEEYTFEDLKSNTGFLLRFDFFIPSLNLLVEVDGEHHKHVTFRESIQRVQLHDEIKEKYAADHGIPLARITLPTYKSLQGRVDLTELVMEHINKVLNTTT